MVNETKSRLDQRDIPELLETIREFREYFPEYKDKKIIGSLATLFADESLIKYASREGILILAVGDELGRDERTRIQASRILIFRRWFNVSLRSIQSL